MVHVAFSLPFLMAIAIAGLVVAAIVWGLRAEKKRTEAMRGVAENLGLSFLPEGGPSLISQWSAFSLFSRGRSKRVKNMIHGETEEVEVGIFEYRYTTGGGDSSHDWRQTVISFRSPDLNLPQFTLRPEGLFDKIGSVLGRRDVDFESHPVFSKKYVLRGRDEERIRRAFRAELLTLLESQSGVSVEGEGQRLIFYRTGKVVPPDQVRAFMEEGFRIYSLLRAGPS